LVKRAKAHKRSLNQEAIACIEETLQTVRPIPGHTWEQRFRDVRELIEAAPLTDDFLGSSYLTISEETKPTGFASLVQRSARTPLHQHTDTIPILLPSEH
jgi:hypothetical protein